MAKYFVKEGGGNIIMEIGINGEMEIFKQMGVSRAITLPKRSSDIFIKTMEVELAAFEQELKNL